MGDNGWAGQALELGTWLPSVHKALGKGMKTFGQDSRPQPLTAHLFCAQHTARGTKGTRPRVGHTNGGVAALFSLDMWPTALWSEDFLSACMVT